jgi:hypothetical protein
MIYNVGRFLFIYKSYGLNPFEKNQFIVIGLAVVTLLTGEYFGQMTDDLFTRVFVVVPIFFILFIVPVFVFKLEPQITQYINNKVRLGIKKKED